MVFVVLYFRLSERQQSLTEHENVRGAQRFQTPSYILSPLDSGPQQSLERLISFLLSFLSKPFEEYRRQRRCFFYFFSNTVAISQWSLPTNWSKAAVAVILYPASLSIFASRRKVIGLQET